MYFSLLFFSCSLLRLNALHFFVVAVLVLRELQFLSLLFVFATLIYNIVRRWKQGDFRDGRWLHWYDDSKIVDFTSLSDYLLANFSKLKFIKVTILEVDHKWCLLKNWISNNFQDVYNTHIIFKHFIWQCGGALLYFDTI